MSERILGLHKIYQGKLEGDKDIELTEEEVELFKQSATAAAITANSIAIQLHHMLERAQYLMSIVDRYEQGEG